VDSNDITHPSDKVFVPFLQHAAEQSRPMASRMLNTAMETMLDRVNKTGEMMARIELEETAQALAKHRGLIEERLAPAWFAAMQHDLRSARQAEARASSQAVASAPNPLFGKTGSFKLEELSLIDDNTMQAKIDAARLQQAAVTGCERELSELDGLVCSLQGLPKVQPARNPLRPQVFIDALVQVIAQTGAAAHHRQMWMQQLRPRIGKELAKVYTELIEGLTARGVEQVGYGMVIPVGGGGGGGSGAGGGAAAGAATGAAPAVPGGPGGPAGAYMQPNAMPQGMPAGAMPAGMAQGVGVPGGMVGGVEGGMPMQPGMMPAGMMPAGMVPTGMVPLPPGAGAQIPAQPMQMPPMQPGSMQAMQAMPMQGYVVQGLSGIAPVMPTRRLDRAQLQQLMQFGGLAEMPAEYAVPMMPAHPGYLAPELLMDDPQADMPDSDAGAKAAAPDSAATPAAEDTPEERSEEVAEIAANVVALLVNNLIEDERLPLAVRQWIKEISPALQKLAENDAQFLNDGQHAARRMLDEVMSRGLTFASDESTGFAEFFGPVKEVEQPLVQHEQPDAEFFERVLAVMKAGWVLYEAQQQEAQEKVIKTAIRRDKRAELAQKMSLGLMRRDEMAGAPIFVKQFIAGTWAQVVADAKLDAVIDFGPQETEQDNARLQAVLQTMADLAWSANPDLASQSKPRLLKLIPVLLKSLRDGLAAIEQSDAQHVGFFDELMKAHEKALKTPSRGGSSGLTQPGALGTASGSVPLTANFDDIMGDEFLDSLPDLFEAPDEEHSVASRAPIPSSVAPVSGSAVFSNSSSSAALPVSSAPGALPPVTAPAPVITDPRPVGKQLKVGTWVEFSNENHPLPVRAQVTWMSPQATMFMFTAAKGQATSMTRRALDKLVDSGKFRIVQRESMVSGALQAVVQKALRESA
jgi:hypothetical protein